MNAAKRFVTSLRADHPQLGIIIGSDARFSKQPIIEDILAKQMHYIFVAKPDDHKTMMEDINGSDDALSVNYFRFQILTPDQSGGQKVSYINSWETDVEISRKNIQTLVKAGRCRWKIENECFNTLKNQGYHIEHNYGHGENNLCYNFYLLTLIAFFFHQIFELTDALFQQCRTKFGSKSHMWESLRTAIKWFIFDSWDNLLNFALARDDSRFLYVGLSP